MFCILSLLTIKSSPSSLQKSKLFQTCAPFFFFSYQEEVPSPLLLTKKSWTLVGHRKANKWSPAGLSRPLIHQGEMATDESHSWKKDQTVPQCVIFRVSPISSIWISFKNLPGMKNMHENPIHARQWQVSCLKLALSTLNQKDYLGLQWQS